MTLKSMHFQLFPHYLISFDQPISYVNTINFMHELANKAHIG